MSYCIHFFQVQNLVKIGSLKSQWSVTKLIPQCNWNKIFLLEPNFTRTIRGDFKKHVVYLKSSFWFNPYGCVLALYTNTHCFTCIWVRWKKSQASYSVLSRTHDDEIYCLPFNASTTFWSSGVRSEWLAPKLLARPIAKVTRSKRTSSRRRTKIDQDCLEARSAWSRSRRIIKTSKPWARRIFWSGIWNWNKINCSTRTHTLLNRNTSRRFHKTLPNLRLILGLRTSPNPAL